MPGDVVVAEERRTTDALLLSTTSQDRRATAISSCRRVAVQCSLRTCAGALEPVEPARNATEDLAGTAYQTQT